MSGRKPLGPGLVQHLVGSECAKERLQVILETIAGRLAINDACERLGIGEARFHQLRTRVLEACVEELEPKPRGRPRVPIAEPGNHEEWEHEVAQLREQLQSAEIRLTLGAILPHVLHEPEKKTARRRELEKVRRSRQRRLNREPK